jgi:hypothetical protein
MADETKTESTETKQKTVAEGMAARRIFSSDENATAIEQAAQYLGAAASTYSDFGDMTIAAPGMDEEGNFDSEVYPETVDVMVSLLRSGGKVKAIVVAPIPRVDDILSNEAARSWATKIIHKELNHVAVRHLRDAEDVSTMVDQMPTSLDAYITSGREGGGGIMEAFDELYKLINSTLAAKLPVWGKARFIKSELKKALESKGYASEYYPALEDYKGESLFVVALNLGVAAAKRKGLDPTIFERWAATRDAKAFTAGEEEDEDSLDLDDLTNALLKSDKPEEAAPTEGTAEAGEPEGSESEPETAEATA